MEQFNDLPLDLQAEILKNSKYGRSISKTSSEHNPKLFYDEYCQFPISKQELLNYIKKFNPPYFILFCIGFHSFVAYVFIWAGGFYQVIEHHYENSRLLSYKRKTSQEYGLINAIYYSSNRDDVIVGADLNLTRSIIEQRQQCKDINYVNDYLKKEVDRNLNKNLNPFKNNGSGEKLFLVVSKNLYLMINYYIIENGVIEEDLIQNYVNDSVGTNFGFMQKNNRADGLIGKYQPDHQFFYELVKKQLGTV